MYRKPNHNLLWRAIRKDLAFVILGTIAAWLPHHGITGKWLGLGEIVGVTVALTGFSAGFYKLFLSGDWMREGREYGVLGRFRLLWFLLTGVIVFFALV